jgi:hypothetical protein
MLMSEEKNQIENKKYSAKQKEDLQQLLHIRGIIPDPCLAIIF